MEDGGNRTTVRFVTRERVETSTDVDDDSNRTTVRIVTRERVETSTDVDDDSNRTTVRIVTRERETDGRRDDSNRTTVRIVTRERVETSTDVDDDSNRTTVQIAQNPIGAKRKEKIGRFRRNPGPTAVKNIEQETGGDPYKKSSLWKGNFPLPARILGPTLSDETVNTKSHDGTVFPEGGNRKERKQKLKRTDSSSLAPTLGSSASSFLDDVRSISYGAGDATACVLYARPVVLRQNRTPGLPARAPWLGLLAARLPPSLWGYPFARAGRDGLCVPLASRQASSLPSRRVFLYRRNWGQGTSS